MMKRWTVIFVAFLLAFALYAEAAEQHVVMDIEGMFCSM